ncbi:MAG TPA: hypothetical protein VEI03_21310 [Stellaceae bacterium]|nr:hypothetical protein [Stellaceae bacterium]
MKTRTLAIGLAGAVLLLGAGAVGAQFLAQAWMARQVDAWLAAPPFTKASHGAVHYALLEGRLAIDDLALESASPALQSLRAAALEIAGGGPGFLFGGGPDLRLAALGARQVELTTGALHASAETLSLTGVRLAGGIGSMTLSYDSVETLKHLSLDRLEASKAHLSIDASGGHTVDLATLVIEHLDKGRCASLAAANGALVDGGPVAPGTATTSIADLHMTGIDFLDLRGVAAPAAPGDTMATLVDTLSATKLLLAVDAGTIAIDGANLAGLRAPPGTWPPPAGLGPDAKSALSGLGLDRLELSNLEVTSAPAIGTRLSVAHLALDKLLPGSLGRLAFETAALKNARGIGHLGSFELADLAYDRETTPLGLPRFFVKRLHLADFSAGEKAGAELGVKEAELGMEGGLGDSRGMQFNIGPILVPATLAPPLTAAGYNELVLDYQGGSRYDAAEGVLEGNQRLSAHEAGALALSLRLEHYPAVFDAQDAAALSAQFMAAELAHFELRYEDASLVDRLLKIHAARTGGDVEQAREEVLGQIEAQRGAFADKPELSASFEAIAEFLRRPKSLTLILAPPKPVALGTLMTLSRASPDQALALLGLSVR